MVRSIKKSWPHPGPHLVFLMEGTVLLQRTVWKNTLKTVFGCNHKLLAWMEQSRAHCQDESSCTSMVGILFRNIINFYFYWEINLTAIGNKDNINVMSNVMRCLDLPSSCPFSLPIVLFCQEIFTTMVWKSVHSFSLSKCNRITWKHKEYKTKNIHNSDRFQRVPEPSPNKMQSFVASSKPILLRRDFSALWGIPKRPGPKQSQEPQNFPIFHRTQIRKKA